VTTVVAGIDLAGVETRPTGICFLANNFVKTKLVYTDNEIISEMLEEKPLVIAIDAPLSLPKGKTIDSKNCIRECDKALRKMGIRFFPLNFGGMRQLTLRGIKLRKKLTELGFTVIETYPGAAQDLLKLPRSKKNKEELRRKLAEMFNLKGDIEHKLTTHELDAVTCAIVAKLYLEGKYIAVGDPEEMLMILPQPLVFGAE